MQLPDLVALSDRNISVIPATAIAAVVVLVVYLVYTAFFNPLAHIPGPTISKWTRLRLKYAILRGDRVRYVHSLHERFGPVVRIAPSEVSLASTSAITEIYKIGSPYKKSNWYQAFQGVGGPTNIFATTDVHRHAHKRQAASSNFSERYLKSVEPCIARVVAFAVQRMKETMDRDGVLDVLPWSVFMANDAIAEASLGDSFRMLELGKRNQYIADLEAVANAGIYRTEFPTSFDMLAFLPFGPVNTLLKVFARALSGVDGLLESYWTRSQVEPEHMPPTTLSHELKLIQQEKLAKSELSQDAAGYIFAGTDTTSTTLTYAVWLLSQHPSIEAELISEVSRLEPDFTDENLKATKLVANVVQETLRLHTAVGQCLPRVVPAGGRELGGFYIPQDTTVGIQAYTMHRDPNVWKEPESFDPTRWENVTPEMKKHFLAFGGGSRICLGMHFAQIELRHAIANFYRAFDSGLCMSSAKGFHEEEMKPLSWFINSPKGKRCLVERRKI